MAEATFVATRAAAPRADRLPTFVEASAGPVAVGAASAVVAVTTSDGLSTTDVVATVASSAVTAETDSVEEFSDDEPSSAEVDSVDDVSTAVVVPGFGASTSDDSASEASTSVASTSDASTADVAESAAVDVAAATEVTAADDASGGTVPVGNGTAPVAMSIQ